MLQINRLFEFEKEEILHPEGYKRSTKHRTNFLGVVSWEATTYMFLSLAVSHVMVLKNEPRDGVHGEHQLRLPQRGNGPIPYPFCIFRGNANRKIILM
jgi:hypothetical protein